MAAEHADWAIETFGDLERRMADVLRVVPYEQSHFRTYSPVLASILLDTCSFTESVLKSSMDNARYNGIANIANLRAKRYAAAPPYLNINDLRTTFRADTLYTRKVWLLSRGEPSRPWYTWRQANVQHPSWWKAYNAAKHDRFGNAKHATLSHTLHALKGAFLCMVLSLEFRDRLVERAIVRCRGLPVNALKPIAAQWEPLPTQEAVVATTSLLGFKFYSQGSPDQAVDTSPFY